MFKRIKIRKYETGLLFKEGIFQHTLDEGTYSWFDPLGKIRVDLVSTRQPYLKHENIEEIVLSKKLDSNKWLTRELSKDQCALEWIDGNLTRLVRSGFHAWRTDYHKVVIEVLDRRTPWLVHAKLRQLVQSGLLDEMLTIVDLQDCQRGLIWTEGRFTNVLSPGLYAYMHEGNDIRVEIIEVDGVRFEHKELPNILKTLATGAVNFFQIGTVNRYHLGILFYDNKYVETLSPGQYVFWKGTKSAQITEIDMRELFFDIAGQEIMTADKVSLRLNAGVNYRITDPLKSLEAVEDPQQAIYKEAQLILRAVVGTRELDQFLSDKDGVADETMQNLRERIAGWGVELVSLGIRDIILPGEMKNLLNKVTEAKKAAEANLVVRREETAAMRSQANTAKILEGNPTLMRLRELEIVEKAASSGKLNIIIGEKGISDKIVNLL